LLGSFIKMVGSWVLYGGKTQLMFMKQPEEGCEIVEEVQMRCGA
jgi:hypothetical protein